jgi:hypothetical protein
MVATGDDPEAPERVRIDHRGDRTVVTLDEADRPQKSVCEYPHRGARPVGF